MNLPQENPRRWLDRETILAAALAVWLGGLVFYATLVIPTGAEILGGHTAFGFITRQVTNKINLLGTGVIVLLSLDGFTRRRQTSRAAWVTLAIMAACQVALFVLHPWLEALLDVDQREILDRDGFYVRHQIYLWTTMIQWLAGAVHFAGVIRRSS